MEDTVAAGAPAGGEPGPLARLAGVLFSPAKTFESIARKPGWDWVIPMVLLMAGVVILQSVAVPKIDVDEAVAQQMKISEKMMGKEIPADKRDEIEAQIRDQFEPAKHPLRKLVPLPFIALVMFLVPAIYHGIAAAAGTKTTYMRLVAGYAYTSTVQLIPLTLATVVAATSSSLSSNDVQFGRILKSNAAAFLDFDTTHKAVLALLSSVDVFDLWGFAVGVIAVSRVTRFGVKGAALTVGGVWGAYILMKVVLGVVFQAFVPA